MADDFVLYSRKARRKARKKSGNVLDKGEVADEDLRRKLDSTKNDLACSDYWETLKKALERDIKPNLICLGLGPISCNVTSRWQTALLMLLKQHLNAQRIVVYDPLFNEAERKVLSDLGYEIPLGNDEGFLDFSDSLFYMPHCGKPLFNSVVYANRKHLNTVTIFGNSFLTMFEQIDFQKRIERGELAALKAIKESFSEVPVENVFQFQDVFNDLSVMRFRSEILEDIPQPVYSRDDEIILREAMHNLAIHRG